MPPSEVLAPLPLLDPAFVADPYPFLARARAEMPVWFAPDFGLWVVTRHADVAAALRDPATFSSANVQKPAVPLAAEARAVLAAEGFNPGVALTATDPPAHGRLRRHLQQALTFTPARLAALEGRIRAATDALIDRFAELGAADLVADLAARLPAQVIFDLIGFPEADHGQLQAWCLDRLRLSWGRASAAEQVAGAHGLAAYWRYCEAHVAAAAAAAEPPATIAGDLVRAHRAAPAELSLHDAAGMVFGLVFAGQETTANLISGTVQLLLARPGGWARARAERADLGAVVEEGLRLTAPIMAWRRITTRPVTLGGVDLPAGAELLLHLGAANRDPALFDDPETFEPGRANAARHLSFGFGVHFCVGAALARLEARIVLGRLLDRFTALEAAPGFVPAYVPNIAFRTLAALPVRWPAGSAA